MSDIQRVTKDCAVCGAPFFPRSSRAKNCPKHVKKMNKPADVASLTAGELIDQYSAYGGQAYDSTGCIPGCVSTGDAATDDAVEQPKARRRWAPWAAAASAVVLAGAATSGLWPDASTTPATGEPIPSVAVTASPEASPLPTFEAPRECDYILDYNNGHRLIASAFIQNTGTVPFTATVTATWRQSSGNHITKVKTVKVPVSPNDTEVYFSRNATSTEVEQNMNLPYGKQCKVEISIAKSE